MLRFSLCVCLLVLYRGQRPGSSLITSPPHFLRQALFLLISFAGMMMFECVYVGCVYVFAGGGHRTTFDSWLGLGIKLRLSSLRDKSPFPAVASQLP